MDAAYRNRQAYAARWGGAGRVVQMRAHLWREIAPRLAGGPVLEIGAGLRPTAPADGALFADISEEALAALERAGGKRLDLDGGIPLPDDSLAGVLAFEVLEHVEDDIALMKEIARTVRPGGLMVCSVPLHMRYWSRLDDSAGHLRRYAPEDLFGELRAAGFRIERASYRFGNPSKLADRLAVGFLHRLPRFTNGLLQRVVFPTLAAWQRRSRGVRWDEPPEPAPQGATGVLVVAVRD